MTNSSLQRATHKAVFLLIILFSLCSSSTTPSISNDVTSPVLDGTNNVGILEQQGNVAEGQSSRGNEGENENASSRQLKGFKGKGKKSSEQIVSHPPQVVHHEVPIIHHEVPVIHHPVEHQVVGIETEEVVKHKMCPVGFELVGKECVMHELFPAQKVCPPNTSSVNGMCAIFSRARKECPPGLVLSGGHCKSHEIFPADFVCPDGSLDETGRGCKIIEPAGPPHCPSGYHLSPAGHCKKLAAAQMGCPEGHVMHKKGGCMRKVSFEASPMCPSGSEIDAHGKKCTKIHHNSPKCPKKYKMDGSQCVKYVKQVEMGCPPGYNSMKHHHMCEKLIHHPAQLACPPDTHLDNHNLCVRETINEPQCPEGFVHGRFPGSCERIAEEVAVCPPGTVAYGDGYGLKCKTTIEHDIVQCCPPGFDMIQDKCERVEVLRPKMSCEDCVTVKTHEPVYVCPPEFTPKASKCVKVSAHPCPSVKSIPVLPHCDPTYAHHYQGVRALKDLLPCPKITEQLCKNEDVIPAKMMCKDGSEFEGGMCVERQTIIPEPICVMGTYDAHTSQCIKVSYVPLKTECHPGTTRIGNKCVEYEEHQPDFICPEGTENDPRGCIVRTPAIHIPPTITTSPSMPVCVVGSLNGNECVEVDRIPREYTCPPGSVKATVGKHGHEKEKEGKFGKCIMVAEFIIKKPHVKHLKPKFICPDGQEAHGKHCHSSEVAPPVASCPHPSHLDHKTNQCLFSIEPVVPSPKVVTAMAVPNCPHGTVLQGTKCTASHMVPANVVCPPGFHLGGHAGMGEKECIKSANFVSVCPAGTTQTSEGCAKQKVLPAKIQVVSRCGKEFPDLCT